VDLEGRQCSARLAITNTNDNVCRIADIGIARRAAQCSGAWIETRPSGLPGDLKEESIAVCILRRRLKEIGCTRYGTRWRGAANRWRIVPWGRPGWRGRLRCSRIACLSVRTSTTASQCDQT
jgi:hypothetical protein